MNSKNLKTLGFIIVGVLIFGIFLRILPYIIIGGFAIYFAIEAYKYIKLKISKTRETSETLDSNYSRSNVNVSDEEFDTSSAIDVDYKDIK